MYNSYGREQCTKKFDSSIILALKLDCVSEVLEQEQSFKVQSVEKLLS